MKAHSVHTVLLIEIGPSPQSKGLDEIAGLIYCTHQRSLDFVLPILAKNSPYLHKINIYMFIFQYMLFIDWYLAYICLQTNKSLSTDLILAPFIITYIGGGNPFNPIFYLSGGGKKY